MSARTPESAERVQPKEPTIVMPSPPPPPTSPPPRIVQPKVAAVNWLKVAEANHDHDELSPVDNRTRAGSASRPIVEMLATEEERALSRALGVTDDGPASYSSSGGNQQYLALPSCR